MSIEFLLTLEKKVYFYWDNRVFSLLIHILTQIMIVEVFIYLQFWITWNKTKKFKTACQDILRKWYISWNNTLDLQYLNMYMYVHIKQLIIISMPVEELFQCFVIGRWSVARFEECWKLHYDRNRTHLKNVNDLILVIIFVCDLSDINCVILTCW